MLPDAEKVEHGDIFVSKDSNVLTEDSKALNCAGWYICVLKHTLVLHGCVRSEYDFRRVQ